MMKYNNIYILATILISLYCSDNICAELLIDHNTNGISDIWEACYSMPNPSSSVDTDGDGQSDFQEGLVGTNPEDADSYWYLKVMNRLVNKPYFRWQSRKGKRYQLERKVAGGTWGAIGEIVTGDGGIVGMVDANVLDELFDYRVVVLDDVEWIPEIQVLLESRDVDEDGQSDWLEWRAGSSIVNPDERFELESVSREDTVCFEWFGVSGFQYQLQKWVDREWVDIGNEMEGGGLKMHSSVVSSETTGIYRLVAYAYDMDDDGLLDWEERLLRLDPEHPHSLEMARNDGEVVLLDLQSGGTVSIETVKGMVSEADGEGGVLRIRREHGFAEIEISLAVGGNAETGVDYLVFPLTVTLPFGVKEYEIKVNPAGGVLSQSKRLIVSIQSSDSYQIGDETERAVTFFKEHLLNVADYGAVGDGVADDTEAIQAAIDDLGVLPEYNGLFFPSGTYLLKQVKRIPVSVVNQVNGRECILTLGPDGLNGRDLLIKGEDGAKLFSEVSPVRAHILLCLAGFRSLRVENLFFEQDSIPLKETVNTEPNNSDGVAIAKIDGRKIDFVSFNECQFVNCHRSISLYGVSYDDLGKLGALRIEHCRILNPYGSNTVNSTSAFGGGQQVYMSSWVGVAYYENNVFEGGGEDMTDQTTSPGGRLKDGSHFGSPLRLYFNHNIVRRMSVEALFQTNENTLLAVSKSDFVVPPADNTTEVEVEVSFNTQIWTEGETIVIRTPLVPGATPSNSLFTIRGFDESTRMLRMSNQGADGSLPEGSVVSSGRIIYLDEREEPTVITVKDNVFDGVVPPGGKAFPVQKGIAFNARAWISGNLITGYRRGIYSYEEAHTPGHPASRGATIENNVVIPVNPVERPGALSIGIQLYGGYEKVKSNLVICPISYEMMGIRPEGQRARILKNTVVAEQIVRNNYRSNARSLGIGFGFGSAYTYARGNYTSGFDNGIGPAKAFSRPSYWVFDHRSYLDYVGVSQAGMITEEE